MPTGPIVQTCHRAARGVFLHMLPETHTDGNKDRSKARKLVFSLPEESLHNREKLYCTTISQLIT